MSKSSNNSRSSKSSSRVMSNNSNRRAKPIVPKAGFTTYRSFMNNPIEWDDMI